MHANTRTPFIQLLHTVQRSRTDRRLGGVCGGLAAASDVPAWAYRAAFLALAVIAVGAIAYAALWLCMPEEPVPAREPAPQPAPTPPPQPSPAPLN
jgi:phage shock protein PspC (stress-responsive transcriptional regulator)